MALILGSQIVFCEGTFYPFQCPINEWDIVKGRNFRFLDGDLPKKPVYCWQSCLAAKGECVFKDNYDLTKKCVGVVVFCQDYIYMEGDDD